jgi:uncharacterized protein YukE
VQFYVSTPALGFSAASMTSAVAQFDAQLAQISATVNAVVGATWTGSAADAFLEEWTSFLASAALTRESIVSIATRLHAAQAGYDGNEGQLTAASRSSTVSIRMPGTSGGNSTTESAQAAPQVQAAPAEGAPMVIDIQATGVADA